MNHRELKDEMEAHLQEKIADLMESGMSETDARAKALREFGNRTLHLEDSRDIWRWPWLDRLVQDLRYALRGMRRSPGFTFAALLTLALGIGGNTAIFSVIDGALLHPIPFPGSDRLVTLYQKTPRDQKNAVSYPNLPGLATADANVRRNRRGAE